jgi:hypothetical protein
MTGSPTIGPWRRCLRLVGAAFAALAISGGGWGDPWGERLVQLPASDVDPALPGQAFGIWLNKNIVAQLPRRSSHMGPFEPCAGQTVCMMVAISIPSRARTLVLRFDRESHGFLGGSYDGPELESRPGIASLAELPGRLTEAARPYPLHCAAGTNLRLREEYAGLIEWCEDSAGLRQGPARAWFSTGRYLMYRGAFRDDLREGPWFECDRFERCGNRYYEAGTARPGSKAP